MKPFLAIWTGDREALAPACLTDAEMTAALAAKVPLQPIDRGFAERFRPADRRPDVWLPKEPGDDRWELHCPQGMPETGDAVVVHAATEARFDGGPHGHATRRTVYLYAPDESAQLVMCRTELRLIHRREEPPQPGFSVFSHPDAATQDSADFWRLFRVPLPEPRYAATFAAPRREPPAPRESRWVADPLARYEAMVTDEESGRVNAAFEHRPARAER